MEKSVRLLAAATTAIRDLMAGYPANEIAAPTGMGIDTLLRDLVTHLRESGVDDEGAWSCTATEGIAVRKSRQTCDECGAHVEEVIGCPDGAEICQQCFDQGSH